MGFATREEAEAEAARLCAAAPPHTCGARTLEQLRARGAAAEPPSPELLRGLRRWLEWTRRLPSLSPELSALLEPAP